MESGNLYHLTDLFRRHDVPCVIIGGYAVAYHGYLRATEDVDLIFHRTPASEVGLLAALGELNAKWIGNEIDPHSGLEMLCPVTESYIRSTHLMMLVTDRGYLDLFDFIPGYEDLSVEEVFHSSIQNQTGRFVSLAWLRKLKSASGRTKDLLDLQNLPEALGN